MTRFRPSWQATVLLGALTLSFLWLGNWQIDRAQQKAARVQAFQSAPQLTALPPVESAVRYGRVVLNGHLDPDRHVLVDNQVFRGRAGVHVLTPLLLDDGRTILVNRGWLPLPVDRRSLPPVPTPTAALTVSGILDEIYRPGWQLGKPDALQDNAWPQLVTYPDVSALERALNQPLYPYVLLMKAGQAHGFDDRDWQPDRTSATKHQARALQWFTFAVAALVIWVYLGLRTGRVQ